MKKKIVPTVVALVIISNFCFGQEKMEKYCEVIANGRRVSIDLGNPNAFFRDSTVKTKLLAVNKLRNAVDVLDYMSRLG